MSLLNPLFFPIWGHHIWCLLHSAHDLNLQPQPLTSFTRVFELFLLQMLTHRLTKRSKSCTRHSRTRKWCILGESLWLISGGTYNGQSHFVVRLLVFQVALNKRKDKKNRKYKKTQTHIVNLNEKSSIATAMHSSCVLY